MRAMLGLALAIAVALHTGSTLADQNGFQNANGQYVYFATQSCNQVCSSPSSSTNFGQSAKCCLDYGAGGRSSVGTTVLPRGGGGGGRRGGRDRGDEGMATHDGRVRGRDEKVQRRAVSQGDKGPPPVSHPRPSNGHLPSKRNNPPSNSIPSPSNDRLQSSKNNAPPFNGNPTPSKGSPAPQSEKYFIYDGPSSPMIYEPSRYYLKRPSQLPPPKPDKITHSSYVAVEPNEQPFEKRRGPGLPSRRWKGRKEGQKSKERQRENRPRQVGEKEG